MKTTVNLILKASLAFFILTLNCLNVSSQKIKSITSEEDIPYLRKQGNTSQLIVDGEPYLVLGGELGNSSASDLKYLAEIFPKLDKMNLNTVLAPVYWELIEPAEGQFDFSLVEGLIREARKYDMKLVLLWFGSWKNSMSCYAPLWVKKNVQRFPRSVDKDGKGLEILSPFSEENRNTDARAFAALMKFLVKIDSKFRTVLMVQVENEIGMIPEARDYSTVANEAFTKPVPQPLIDYLQKNKDFLIPEFRKVWEDAGTKTSGTWEEVFGKGLMADEIFMAWYFGKYTNYIADAGKNEYPLPMFVNAALIRPNYKPGQYPSAGPLPHLMDIWRVAAPRIDFLSPDIYFPNFAEWCQKYQRSGNPLFIPEAQLSVLSTVNAFYAIGQHDAIGFSPFSIESANDNEASQIAQSYEILGQLAPVILKYQGKGVMAGIILDSITQIKEVQLGDYTFKIRHQYNWLKSPKEKNPEATRAGGIIISTAADEFIFAGSGLVVTFTPNTPGDDIAGIGSIDEGYYSDGVWMKGRRLNGDQNHQGRHLWLPLDQFAIQKLVLYRYK